MFQTLYKVAQKAILARRQFSGKDMPKSCGLQEDKEEIQRSPMNIFVPFDIYTSLFSHWSLGAKQSQPQSVLG